MTLQIPALPPISRETYEAVCAAHGLNVQDDDTLGYLADCYSFGAAGTAYTSLNPIQKLDLHNRLQRGYAVLPDYRDRAADRLRATCSAPPMIASGQLWEGCRRCGQQPVYQPSMLCRECHPPSA